MTAYTFARNAGPEDWVALPRKFVKGETIYRFSGHDYGCARDDLMYGNRSTISCTEKRGVLPFFTVPVEFILDEGEHPDGTYVRLPIPDHVLKSRVKHNPDLPKLLRAIAGGTDAKEKRHDIIFNAAADELELWRSSGRLDEY